MIFIFEPVASVSFFSMLMLTNYFEFFDSNKSFFIIVITNNRFIIKNETNTTPIIIVKKLKTHFLSFFSIWSLSLSLSLFPSNHCIPLQRLLPSHHRPSRQPTKRTCHRRRPNPPGRPTNRPSYKPSSHATPHIVPIGDRYDATLHPGVNQTHNTDPVTPDPT